MPAFSPDARLKGGRNAGIVSAKMAREFYTPIIPIVMELHGQRLSLREIAADLERRKIKSRRGWPRWSAAQVRRILIRGSAAELPLESQLPPAAETAAPAGQQALASPEIPAESQQSPDYETPPPAGETAPPAAGSILLLIDEAEQGPFTSSQVEAMLDASEITPETLFRRDGMAEWRALQTAIAAQ